MIQQDQLASFLDEALDAGPRAALEQALEQDAKALRFVIEQRNLDRALRSLLGSAAHRERLKESILASVVGASIKQLQAQVLADTSGRAIRPAFGDSPSPGWPHRIQTWIGNHLQFFPSPKAAWFAFASVILLLAVGTWLLLRPAPTARIAVGQFAAVVGEPVLKHNGKSSTPALNPPTPIYLGDRLETGDADKAEIVFRDGTTLRLGFNTSVELPTLNPQSSTLNPPLSRPPEINLRRGQVWTKVQKSTNAPQYAIRTEAATAVARGTEFGVKIQRSASTNSSAPTTVLTVKEGAVDFSNSLGSVQATAMTESTATSDSAPSWPVRLNTIKSFDLIPGQQLILEGLASPFDLNPTAYRMGYPQGWAGIYVRSIQEEKDAAVRRLRIVRVWPGSPAEQAGLAVGDVVTEVNGQSVTNLQDVLRPIYYGESASVALSISRGELSKTVSLVTTKHPYALPMHDIPGNLAKEVFDPTWRLVEADCKQTISSNEWSELGQEFKNVLNRYPELAALHNNLAVWYEVKDEFSSAIQHFKQAVASAPGNALYHYNLGKALGSIGNFERYAEETEEALRLAPEWVPGLIALAEAYTLLGRQDEAVAVLEHSLEIHPSRSDLWCAKGFVHLSAEQTDEALAAALKAVELEPSYAVRFLWLSFVCSSRGESDASEAALRKAIEFDPGLPEAYVALAVDVIGRLGNRLPEDPSDARTEDLTMDRWRDRPPQELAIIAEAERLCHRAIELNPDSVGAYVDLGNCFLMRGAVDEAEKWLRKVVEMDPNGQAADAYNALAYRFAGWGIRLDDALQFAQRAVQLARTGATFDTLAMVHFRRGEWDQAEAAWKQCIEFAGPQGDPGAWFHLGKLYQLKNRTDVAITAYQEALRLRPDYPAASRALAKLRP